MKFFDSSALFYYYLIAVLALVAAGVLFFFFVPIYSKTEGVYEVSPTRGAVRHYSLAEGELSIAVNPGSSVVEGQVLASVDTALSESALSELRRWFEAQGGPTVALDLSEGSMRAIRKHEPELFGSLAEYGHALTRLREFDEARSQKVQVNVLERRLQAIEQEKEKQAELLQRAQEYAASMDRLWGEIETDAGSLQLSQVEMMNIQRSVLSSFEIVQESLKVMDELDIEYAQVQLDRQLLMEEQAVERLDLLHEVNASFLSASGFWKSWYSEHVVEASQGGYVTFARAAVDRGLVKVDDLLFAVADEVDVRVHFAVRGFGSGAVESGDRVRVLVDRFLPDGSTYIEGRVSRISERPIDGSYIGLVETDETSRHLTAGMSGALEIMASKSTVWQRTKARFAKTRVGDGQ